MTANFLIKPGSTVVFIGDSITDCDRRYGNVPFGTGYVKLAIDLINAKYPGNGIEFHNEGIGGNTVLDLYGRWDDDVIRRKPDWLTVKIGINDLHQHLGNPSGGISPQKYEELYAKILETAKSKTKAKIVLIDPFYISTDYYSGSFRTKVLNLIPEYINIVHKLSSKYKTLLVKTHEVFQNHLKYKNADEFAPEPVHPYVTGHVIIAYSLLEVLNW